MTKLTDKRLLITALLFVGWLGYLGVLVATRPASSPGWPLVVSRPQVLTSEVDIIAEVDDPNQEVTVVEVLWAKEGPDNAPLKEGDRLKVDNIDACYPVPRRPGEEPPADFSGPGRYLLPLRRVPHAQQGTYEIAPIPPSPGFTATVVDLPSGERRRARLYPATNEALAQYRRIEKPRRPGIDDGDEE